jgi:hypothetical protein
MSYFVWLVKAGEVKKTALQKVEVGARIEIHTKACGCIY